MNGRSTQVATELFRRGVTALGVKDFEGAANLFRRALEIERRREHGRPDMRYLSYYGLSLAQGGLSTQMALEACRKAVTQQADDPILHLNLGRVYLILERTTDAMSAFENGLRIAPMHQTLRRELAPIDRRGRPMIPLLNRSNPLSNWIGRAMRGKRPRAS